MTHIPPQQMISFVDELTKLGWGYGHTLATGAGVGALANVLRHRLNPAEKGQPQDTVGQALRGALVGGGLAGGGILATKGGRDAARQALTNFYQKERYHLTGQGLEGDTPAAQLEHAKKLGIVRSAPSLDEIAKPGLLSRAWSAIRGTPVKAGPTQKDQQLWDYLRRAQADDIEHFKKGYKNMPGVLAALTSKDAPDLLASNWRRMHPIGKAMVGYGAYKAGKGFLETPQEGGPGRFEKGLRGVGDVAAQMIAPGSIAPRMLNAGLGGTGGAVGKYMDVGTNVIRGGFGRVVPASEQAPEQPTEQAWPTTQQ